MAKAKQNSSPFSLLYILLFTMLPMVYATSLVDNTLVSRQLFVSIGMLVILVVAWSRIKLAQYQPGPMILFFAGFLLINILAVSAAINPVESWATISRYVMAFCFLVITTYLLRTRDLTIRQLVVSIICFGAITAVITLFNFLSALVAGDFLENIYSVAGTFGHKNLLSSALLLSFPFAVMGSVLLSRGSWRKASLVLAFLMVVEMFVLRTRGVWLSMFTGSFVAIAAFFSLGKKSAAEVKFPYKWVGVGLAIAVVLILFVFTSRGVSESITDPTNLGRRIIFWENSIEIIKENPLLGVGPGNWKIHFPKHGLATLEQLEAGYRLDASVFQGVTQIQRPHNDYLWVWTEAGPVGLLFFLGIFASALWALWRNLSSVESREELTIDLAVLFGLVAYLTFSLTDFPIERTSHTILCMSLLALSYRKLNLRGFLMPAKIMLPLLLVGLAFSVAVSWYRWQGEQYTVEVHEANSRQDPRRIIPAAEAAVNPFYNMDYFANPMPYYSSLGKLFLNDLEGAHQDAENALEIHPYNIISLNQMGNVLKMQGQVEEALDYYHRATDISIRFETAQLNKAEIYAKRNNPAEAMSALSYVSFRSQNPKFQRLLGQVLPQLVAQYPDHHRFKKIVTYIQERNPRNREDYMRYYFQMREENY